MDPTTWQKIDQLFHEASELDEGERAAFLDRRCGEDLEIRAEVESLLAYSGPEETLIENAVLAAVAEAASDLEGKRTDQRIGPYRILQEIGRGGASTVYLAERADGQFEMQVAMKVLRQAVADGMSQQRLEQERQILARLIHPNISRLLDAGATPDGLPYFVMEYIEGEDLETYCTRRSLPIQERLELFVQVCSAVEVAHQNLVIHRDIKPANLMVTRQGVPKLLDFGISKLLAGGTVEPLRAPTLLGERPMTPLFASPEQVRGEPLTTGTDVYSLGVVLYRLATGQHPYPIEGAGMARLEALITESEPSPPSLQALTETAIEGGLRPLSGGLSAELDAIVLKALRKEPERRYPSPGQLAEDLRRLLDGRPVLARPDTLGYRLRKLFARHRVAALGIMATVLTLLALTTFYTTRLAAERDRAHRSAEQADQVSEMMVGLFQIADPQQSAGETVTARELLKTRAELIENGLADQPVVQANLLRVIGQAYKNLGLYIEAERLFDRSLEGLRNTSGADPQALVKALAGFAEVNYFLGARDKAETLLREAADLARDHLGESDKLTLETRLSLGTILFSQGKMSEAEVSLGEAHRGLVASLGADHPSSIIALNNLANLEMARDNHSIAEVLLQDALERRRRVDGESHPGVATILLNLAHVAVEQERDDLAARYYEEALEINRHTVGLQHPSVVHILEQLGVLAQKSGLLEKARERLEEAITLLSGLQPPDVVWGAILQARLTLLQIDQGECRNLEEVVDFLERAQKLASGGELSRLLEQVKQRSGECGG